MSFEKYEISPRCVLRNLQNTFFAELWNPSRTAPGKYQRHYDSGLIYFQCWILIFCSFSFKTTPIQKFYVKSINPSFYLSVLCLWLITKLNGKVFTIINHSSCCSSVNKKDSAMGVQVLEAFHVAMPQTRCLLSFLKPDKKGSGPLECSTYFWVNSWEGILGDG